MRVRIPADVERPDTLLAGLTARQLAILASAATVVWGAWGASRAFLPLPVFAGLVSPVGVGALALALGRRDGLSGDRFALAGWAHLRTRRRQVNAPEGIATPPVWAGSHERPPAPLRFPALDIDRSGVIDLGADGSALICRASSLNFGLRTEAEQHALVGAFGRFCNSLTDGVQVVVRATHADLRTQIAELDQAASGLAHPALETAALGHAAYLASLAERRDVVRRDVLVVFRDPRPSGTTAALSRRAEEAASALAAAGITLTALDGDGATAVLRGAVEPDELVGHVGPRSSGDVVRGARR